MDSEAKKLLEKYGGRAPRYTSYPPATQFRSADSADSYRDGLKALQKDHILSLYIHVPFCRSLCSYCGCMTRVVHNDDPIRDYVRMLEKEIDLVAATLPHRHRVSHIHFGGGSPNLLLNDDLGFLLNSIREKFLLLPDVEIAMEADPRQLTHNKINDYACAGVNRISLGVQDFNEDTQKAINRIQPFAQIELCVRWIRDSGIDAVNFDLMYGLPCQTVDSVADNIVKAVSLGPDRVALFGYAHVPWMKQHQKLLEKYALPDPAERYAQAEMARGILLQNGYCPIGMDHFAKETDTLLSACKTGSMKRNFQGYTNDNADVLLGFGLSAISKLPNAYVQNTTSPGLYKEKLEKGLFADERWIHISDEDRLRSDIIESLMCYFSVDCAALCRKHGFPATYFDRDLEKLGAMEGDGLLRVSGHSVTVTEAGVAFIRTIAACFDAYYSEEGPIIHVRTI